jgi:alpha-tubulin suppressor-like RCC1 family protein
VFPHLSLLSLTVLGTTQGKLYGFGSNYYGQLAGKTAIGDFTFKPSPIVAPAIDGRKFVDVQAGGDNTIAQTLNGTEQVMWLFGSNRYGQLGVQENAGEWDFNPDPRSLTTCELMDPEFCDQYTVLSSSVGSDFAIIQTAAKV